MPNAAAHTLGAAIGVGLIHLANETANAESPSPKPMVSAALGACLGRLPDRLGQATNPNHRQPFHSVAFAGVIIYACKKLYVWRPEDELGKVVRYVSLVACAAYGVHLAMDARTKKSLPVVGKLQVRP